MLDPSGPVPFPPSRPPAGRAAWLLGLGLLVAGCYSFTGSNLPGHVKSLAVPTITNKTLEPGVEQEITEGITQRFIADGRLRIASARAADARLEAELTSYENKVNNYSADQNPLDYIVVLQLSARLRDQVKNRDLWVDEALVATAVYDPTAGQTEEQARGRAITDLADLIVGRTLEQW